MVWWLGLCALTAVGLGSVPDSETKIPQGSQCSQKVGGNIYIYIYINFFDIGAAEH